jgi:hypothetical protein
MGPPTSQEKQMLGGAWWILLLSLFPYCKYLGLRDIYLFVYLFIQLHFLS